MMTVSVSIAADSCEASIKYCIFPRVDDAINDGVDFIATPIHHEEHAQPLHGLLNDGCHCDRSEGHRTVFILESKARADIGEGIGKGGANDRDSRSPHEGGEKGLRGFSLPSVEVDEKGKDRDEGTDCEECDEPDGEHIGQEDITDHGEFHTEQTDNAQDEFENRNGR